MAAWREESMLQLEDPHRHGEEANPFLTYRPAASQKLKGRPRAADTL